MNKIYKNKSHLIQSVIKNTDTVLDVGFWGQGVSIDDKNWVHNLLKKYSKDVCALDVDFDDSKVEPKEKYFKANAEDFWIPKQFDVVFAGDLIEHLSNPGLFLLCAKKHLKDGGRIIVTTPNAFNLFNISEKFSKGEPTVNPDHTCYFNSKTLKQLFKKNGLEISSIDYVYTLGLKHKESVKKKFLNLLYKLFSLKTPAFVETIVITANL